MNCPVTQLQDFNINKFNKSKLNHAGVLRGGVVGGWIFFGVCVWGGGLCLFYVLRERVKMCLKLITLYCLNME